MAVAAATFLDVAALVAAAAVARIRFTPSNILLCTLHTNCRCNATLVAGTQNQSILAATFAAPVVVADAAPVVVAAADAAWAVDTNLMA